MLNANLSSAVIIRQFEQVEPDGTLSDRQSCCWGSVAFINCGMMHSVSDKLMQMKEFEINSESKVLSFDSKDQKEKNNFTDIKKTDYLVYSRGGSNADSQFYKIVGIVENSGLCGYVYDIILDRKEPRDCGCTELEISKFLTIPEKYR